MRPEAAYLPVAARRAPGIPLLVEGPVSVGEHPLDDPIRAALLGPHARFAEHRGAAVRYPSDVAPFLAPPRDAQEWGDAAALVGSGARAVVESFETVVPGEGWTVERTFPGVQMVAETVRAEAERDAVVLGPADADEVLALVATTRPGPFERRTVAMGTYLGLRVDGALVAMAGERLHPPGYTEISAICTHPDHQGRGYATRLVRDLVGRIRARGETPFLHAVVDNTHAIGLYSHLGFRLRAHPDFVALLAPDHARTPDPREQRPAAAR